MRFAYLTASKSFSDSKKAMSSIKSNFFELWKSSSKADEILDFTGFQALSYFMTPQAVMFLQKVCLKKLVIPWCKVVFNKVLCIMPILIFSNVFFSIQTLDVHVTLLLTFFFKTSPPSIVWIFIQKVIIFLNHLWINLQKQKKQWALFPLTAWKNIFSFKKHFCHL